MTQQYGGVWSSATASKLESEEGKAASSSQRGTGMTGSPGARIPNEVGTPKAGSEGKSSSQSKTFPISMTFSSGDEEAELWVLWQAMYVLPQFL